jgi:hypothetical protein
LGRRNATQSAAAAKIANHASAHSGIDRPSSFQSTCEQVPVPWKILGRAWRSGSVLSMNSRSVPQLSMAGGKCCRYEWRIDTPTPATAKSATRTA